MKSSSPIPSRRGLVERDQELSRIDAGLASARSGLGQLVVVEAVSGMGKTALLDEARRRAISAGMNVLHSAGSAFETDYTFGTIVTLFSTSGSIAGDLFRGRAASCSPLFGAARHNTTATNDREQFGPIDGLFWLTVNISQTGPTVLLIDDAHYADEMSLRFLAYLTRRISTLPIVVILALRAGTARSEEPLIASLTAACADGRIRLGPLSPAGVEEYLRRSAPKLLSADGFAAACATVTAGNPLFVHELVTALHAEGLTGLAAPTDRLGGFVSPAVQQKVMLELSQLGSDEVSLARACAVLEHDVTLGVAALLAGIRVEAAAHAADRLIKAGILAPAQQLTFTQPMTRSAIYHDMPLGERSLAHAAAAALLRHNGERPDAVAHHLLMGTPVSDAWAADALHSGAMSAARSGSPATAIKYLRQAIIAELPERQRSSLLLDLGLLEAAVGQTETAVTRLESAIRLVDAPVEQAKCLYALGLTLYRDGRHGEAAGAFERSAAAAGETDDELALAAEGAWIFTSYYLDAVPPTALTRLEKLSAQIRQHGVISPADRSVLAVAALRSSMTTPPASHGAKMAAQALDGGVLLGARASDNVASALAVLALTYGGHLDEATTAVNAILSDAHARGNVPGAAEASLVRSFVHLARGHVGDAFTDARAAADGVAKGWLGLAPLAVGTLVQCHIERDEVDAAEAVLREAERTVVGSRPPSNGLNSWIHMSRGRLRYCHADMQGALEEFMAAGQALSVFGTTNPAVLRWRTMAGLSAKALGGCELAADLIDQELRLAESYHLNCEIGAALRAKAALASGRRRESLLYESLKLLEDSGGALDLAETLYCLGAHIRRSGQRVQARKPLSQAMDIAHRNGALAIVRRARQELLASGAKPRRPTTSGVESLTPTERRIAAMAAEGRTNPEIAESLFLAKSTVAWHLRHIFLKLHIDSRSDLREKLVDGSDVDSEIATPPVQLARAVSC